jgi:Iron-containing redox enzyme
VASAISSVTAIKQAQTGLLDLARQHPCARHRLFETLANVRLTPSSAAALLRNYDAHAGVLRRLLLRAATMMPEPAVGFVLENVRNEYGNGNYADNHQGQLRDVAAQAGVTDEIWQAVAIQPGVRKFIRQAVRYYHRPPSVLTATLKTSDNRLCAAAICAGAITATELLAIGEFKALQKAFAGFGLSHHRWFDHVTIEEEHSDESLQLALYFADRPALQDAVEIGMEGILNANVDLYDGLLAAITTA